MDLPRKLGLAALAAVAVIASAAGVASAVEEKTVLCKAPPNEAAKCEAGLYPGGTKIKATSIKAVFTTENPAVEVICGESVIEGETTAEKGSPRLGGKIAELNFGTVCLESVGNTKCVVEVMKLPYGFLLSHSKAAPGNGEMIVFASPGGGPPSMLVKCPTLPNPLLCVYQVAEVAEGEKVARLQVKGGNPAKITANHVELSEVAGECPGEKPAWDGEYTVEAPKPVWVAQVE